VDVLVNDAAVHYATRQHASSADPGVVREAVETNFHGPWRLAPGLLRAARSPRVVNVSSEAGSPASMGGGRPAYGASKAALNALTLVLVAELPAMEVDAGCSGRVATDMGGRPVGRGAVGVAWAATVLDDGPTGGSFRDGARVAR
jgi:NAD(P)-dependent dehydrogenase (short-subunit alcohol dehydrogenase family)